MTKQEEAEKKIKKILAKDKKYDNAKVSIIFKKKILTTSKVNSFIHS